MGLTRSYCGMSMAKGENRGVLNDEHRGGIVSKLVIKENKGNEGIE